ncbi:hypothetical protein [Shewanella sp.]|uniref:hypothetical protein n=1 Tax=Shewanella sp. TaxID=50422 RepID=UPI00405419D8
MLITHTHLKPDSKYTDERSATVKNAAKNTLIEHFEQAMNAPQIKTETQLKQQDLQKHSTTTETAEKNEPIFKDSSLQQPAQSQLLNNKMPLTLTKNNTQQIPLQPNAQPEQQLINTTQALISALAQTKTNEKNNTKTKASSIAQPLKAKSAQEDVVTSSASATGLHQAEDVTKTSIGKKTPPDNSQTSPTARTTTDKQAPTVPKPVAPPPQLNKPVTAVDERLPVAKTQVSTNKFQQEDKLQDINLGTQKAPLDNLNNTPGNIILSNLKTPEPMSFERQQLISQLIDKVQILIPSLGHATPGQNRVQLVLEKGLLKGTEITISLQNNQLSVNLIHSNEHAQLLQHARPELLERLQKLNPELQVRIVTSSQEQTSEPSQQDQGQQQESSQKSRVFDTWLEEQENA